MAESSVRFPVSQVRDGIYEQYEHKRPRPGIELDAFISEQCAYFGIDPRECQRHIANAKSAIQARNRRSVRTEFQELAEGSGFAPAKILQTLWDGMDAVRRRPVVDKSGNALKDEKGELLYFEQPDNAARIQAADKAAKIMGAYAPKELRVESTHDVNVTIDERSIRVELAALLESAAAAAERSVDQADAGRVVEGAYIAGGPADDAGREGSVLLGDGADADD